MTRGRILLLAVVASVVGIGALLIPSGGGADTTADTPFIARIEQGGVPVTAITVVCPNGATSGAPQPALFAHAASAAVGVGNTGSGGKTIAVSRGGTTRATITQLDTSTAITETALPCSGSVSYIFQPKKNNGTNTGTVHNVAVAIVGVPS